MSAERRRQSLDAIRDLNQMRYDVLRDPEIATRIAAYEMAYRMQTSVPDVMDISKEPPSHAGSRMATTPGRASFANNCLLARRLVERGVRFVQLYPSRLGPSWRAGRQPGFRSEKALPGNRSTGRGLDQGFERARSRSMKRWSSGVANLAARP